MIRTPGVVVAAVALAATLTACGPGSPPAASDDPSTPASTSTSTSTPAASAEPGGEEPDPVTAPPCERNALTNVFTETDASAGHRHGLLTVTNISSAACSLTGAPTVYLGNPEAAIALGAGSTPDPADPGTPLDLAPGASAVAHVTIAAAGNVDGCGTILDTVSMIYVLPGETFEPQVNGQHVYLDSAVSGCINEDLSLLTVGGFAAG